MKNRLILATSLALALSSQPATANSITDTYATGDTLTAAKMNNIKAAVNDNDSKITAKQDAINADCTAGSFIQSIDPLGNVVCDIDTDTNTTYSAGSGLTLTNTTLSITPKIDSIYILGGDFNIAASGTVDQWYRDASNGGYGYALQYGRAVVTAGVNLPNGAVITAVGCYYSDYHITAELYATLYLYQANIGSNAAPVELTAITESTNGTPGMILVEQTGLTTVVDNSLYYYYFMVEIEGADANIQLNGCRIQYTH